MRRLVGFVVIAVALTVVPGSAHAAAGDAATGRGSVSAVVPAEFDFRARSGPQGQNPSGRMHLRTASFEVLADVTCLSVAGNVATIIGTVTSSEGLDPSQNEMTFIVGDNKATQTPDTFTYVVAPAGQEGCFPHGQFHPVDRGNIKVRDR
jgi:hypothetical protein